MNNVSKEKWTEIDINFFRHPKWASFQDNNENHKNKRKKFEQLKEKAFAKERTQHKAQDNHTQLI